MEGLFSKEPELFFFIQVPERPNQDVPIRSFGVAFKRTASRSEPMKEHVRDEPGAMHFATEARFTLIANFRRALSLIAASEVLPEPEIRTVRILTLTYIAEAFAKYLTDIFGEISKKSLAGDSCALEVHKEMRGRMVEKLKSVKIEEFLADPLLPKAPSFSLSHSLIPQTSCLTWLVGAASGLSDGAGAIWPSAPASYFDAPASAVPPCGDIGSCVSGSPGVRV